MRDQFSQPFVSVYYICVDGTCERVGDICLHRYTEMPSRHQASVESLTRTERFAPSATNRADASSGDDERFTRMGFSSDPCGQLATYMFQNDIN